MGGSRHTQTQAHTLTITRGFSLAFSCGFVCRTRANDKEGNERASGSGCGGCRSTGKWEEKEKAIKVQVQFECELHFSLGKATKTCCNRTHKAINAAIKRYMKNREYAGQHARRTEAWGKRGAHLRLLPTKHLQKAMGATIIKLGAAAAAAAAAISRSMLHNAKNWSRDQRAGAEASSCRVAARAWATAPGSTGFPCPTTLSVYHKPYTIYHMHTVIWNTRCKFLHPRLGSRICRRMFRARNQNSWL